MAYRYRVIAEVKYGHIPEVFDLIEEMQAVTKQRGWAETTYWMGVVGKSNVVIGESEYPTIEAWDTEQKAILTDSEYMKLVRRVSEFVVQGSSSDELLEPIFHIG